MCHTVNMDEEKQTKGMYMMGGIIIVTVKGEKDLGIIIQDTLIPENQIKKIFIETQFAGKYQTGNSLPGWGHDELSNNNIDQIKARVCSTCLVTSQRKGHKKTEEDSKDCLKEKKLSIHECGYGMH